MRQEDDYICRNCETRGVSRLLGTLIRRMRVGRLILLLPSDSPLVKIESGRNSALIPLSLAKRIVDEASGDAFGRSTTDIRLDGGRLIDILEKIECERMPLRTRYAVIEALCVGWAAAMFTLVGDVTIEADHDTVARARAKGDETGYRRTDANLQLAIFAATTSGRSLNLAA